MENIIADIEKELKANIDEKYKKTEARLFKEGRKVYGVRTPLARNIGKKYWKLIQNRDKKNVFGLCEKLLGTGFHEPLTIAFRWALNSRKNFEVSDFEIFEKWLEKYVNNWSACDDICSGPLGFLIFDFPGLLPKVFGWGKNKNRWFRRASAVCLIPSLRRGKYLENGFKTADALIGDKDDLVQKGYGWMLKEASNKFQKEVFDYVMENKTKLDTGFSWKPTSVGFVSPVGVVPLMSRIALRYAIEKMPEDMRQRAMK